MPTLHNVLRQLRTASVRGSADISDGQLLEQFLARRDEAASEMLVRRHGPMVLGVCQRVLRNAHDVDDAFQATFLVLVRKAHSIVPRENVANWLFGVAYRTALKARMLMAKRGSQGRHMRAAADRAGREEKLWQDVLPLLDEELAWLPERYRTPIVLCDLEGKTRKEAARQLGWPEGTVAGRLARGRVLLAERLRRRGVVVPGGLLAVLLVQRGTAGCVPALVRATVQTALAYTGFAAAGAVPPKVAVLTQGVLRTMLLSKLKMSGAVALLAGLLVLGGGWLACQALADNPGSGASPTPAALGPQGAAPQPGDALPKGAVARLGSNKLRHGGV